MKKLALLCSLLSAVLAQDRPKPTPEIEALLDSALAAPPELAADILITLVDRGSIPSRQHRLEVLDRAFNLAALAKFPTNVRYAVGGAAHTDSSPGIRQAALERGLSTIGLRCRVVRSALTLDKAKALDLFRRITLGPFPPLSCDDPLSTSIAEYYEVLREVATAAYSPEDYKKGRHIELIESAVRSISIPSQIEPAAKLLAVFPLPAGRRAEVAAAYTAALAQLNATPRAFGSVGFGLGQSLLGLSVVLRKEGASTIPLAHAFRGYLERHLKGPLCAETADPKAGGNQMRQVVEKYLNDGLIAQSGSTDLKPLDYGDLKPSSIEGAAKFSDYWANGRSREIMVRYKDLRFGTKEQQAEYNKRERRKDGMGHFLPEEIRRTAAWETQAREFLSDLDRWNKDHTESEIDFFHQICLQYGSLLDIIPAGALHDTVLQTFISFLKNSPMERDSPPEWLRHVRRLFTITDATPKHLELVRAEVRKYGSLTMSLYAELAALEPRR